MKKIFLMAAMLPLCVAASAQGFAKFQAEGVKGTIRNFKNKPSKVEVIVSPEADIRAIDFNFKLLSGCEMSNELTKDFSKAQTTTIHKNDGTSKEWVVEVKQLIPASLPLTIDFGKNNPAIWSAAATGWVNYGTDESKSTVARFGGDGTTFTAAINGEPTEVSFDLYAVGKKPIKFDGDFEVQTSADGKKWKSIKGFDSSDIQIDSKFTCPLKKSDRFIRWTYVTRVKTNINLNNISIK